MHVLTTITGLSLAILSEAVGERSGKSNICRRSEFLFANGQLTCAAPQLSPPPPPSHPQPQKFLQVEPELWTDNDERYNPNTDYTLPPPWQGPSHCFTQFCLFSNPHLDDGTVLITTARNAYLAASFPVPASSQRGVEPTAFYEAEVPEKGIGLIANRTIKKGEIVMQRTPALLIQSTPHLDLEPEVREELYKEAVGMLPEAMRNKFMRQMGETVYDKVEKNSFRMFVDGERKYSAHLGLFPEVSRMNHDCRPNLHYRLSHLTHTTIAVRDIHPGEELTISYIFPQTLRSDRQEQLSSWGFNCSCSQCTLSPLESALSDARIRQIKTLEDEIEARMKKSVAQPKGQPLSEEEDIRPEMAAKLVELYLAERLEAYLAPTYTRAALIYSMFGNEKKAREYAGEAVRALEREYGEGARDAESMRALERDPRAHWSWGVKVRVASGGKGGRGERGRNGTAGGR